MKGRTRSFFEDVFVLSVIVGLFIAGYCFFFNENEQPEDKTVPIVVNEIHKEEPVILEEEVLIQKQQEEIIEQNNTINNEQESVIPSDTDKENRVEEEEVGKEQKEVSQEVVITDPSNKTEIQLEGKPLTQKVDPDRIAHLVKNVDLKLLKQFKSDVKQMIYDKLVFEEAKEPKEQSFSIRITVLKNGEYEHLTFTGGDKEIFEKNQENILKVFPLTIDPKIAQDFPRYLRYTFRAQ
jgi:hypothetical protein